MKRNQPLRQRQSCDHAGCRGSTICRRKGNRLRRSAPPSRHGSLPRGRLKARNPERRSRLFAEAFGGEERVEWTRHQFCVVPGCDVGPCEVAHVKSRGAGGTADDTVPMCPPHHREQHDIGIRTFEGKYGLDLEALAQQFARLWSAWCRRNPNEGGGV